MQAIMGGRGGLPGVATGHAGLHASGMYARPGPWNREDDNLLAAIVTEFSQVGLGGVGQGKGVIE